MCAVWGTCRRAVSTRCGSLLSDRLEDRGRGFGVARHVPRAEAFGGRTRDPARRPCNPPRRIEDHHVRGRQASERSRPAGRRSGARAVRLKSRSPHASTAERLVSTAVTVWPRRGQEAKPAPRVGISTEVPAGMPRRAPLDGSPPRQRWSGKNAVGETRNDRPPTISRSRAGPDPPRLGTEMNASGRGWMLTCSDVSR